MDQEKIGKFIKKIRQENHLTQKELADQLGVTYQAVSKWENGKNVPDISILKEISRLFELNIDDILEGKSSDKKKNTKLLKGIILLLCIFLVGTILLLIYNQNNSNFELKTISSKCTDFKITGSAAYNQKKASIYISSIEFCGNKDDVKYKQLDCTLYENYQDTKTKISSCETKKDMNLENFLKGMNIHVENFTASCKKLTSSNLTLEIEARTSENKIVKYMIPIKIDESCS